MLSAKCHGFGAEFMKLIQLKKYIRAETANFNLDHDRGVKLELALSSATYALGRFGTSAI